MVKSMLKMMVVVFYFIGKFLFLDVLFLVDVFVSFEVRGMFLCYVF